MNTSAPEIGHGSRLPIGPLHTTVLASMDFEAFSLAGFEWREDLQKWTGLNGSTKDKGLPQVGARVYAEHPSTEVLCLSYNLKDGLGIRRWRPGRPLPQDLFDHVARGGHIEAHNAMFEKLIWEFVCVRRYGWPPCPPHSQWRCSAAKSRAWGLPGALGEVGMALGTVTQKDKRGKELIKLLSMPQNPTKKQPLWRLQTPELLDEMQAYCDTDEKTESEVSLRVPDLIPMELDYWLCDQAINYRGIGVDIAAVRNCVAIVNQVLEHYNQEMVAVCGLRTSQAKALVDWLAAAGVTGSDGRPCKSLAAAELEYLYENRDRYSPEVARVIEVRALTGSASVKKVFAMLNHATVSGRLCDLFIYHGARTGRDTHSDVQPGNLPKAGPEIRWCTDAHCGKPYAYARTECPWCGASDAFSAVRGSVGELWRFEAVEHVLEVITLQDMHALEWFFGDALLCITGVVRSLLCAALGNKLVCSDYSSIEAVVAACISGEEWRIEAFRNREDIYYHGASDVTGISYQEYKAWAKEHGRKHPDRQKIGKPCLGPRTQVLTERGYLDIVDVQLADRVWDGVEWVSHQGLLDQGIKNTIELDGVQITPDHRVNIKGSWMEAKELVSNPSLLTLSLATALGSLPPQEHRGENQATERQRSSVRAVANPILSIWRRFMTGALRAATSARKKPLLPTARCSIATRTRCQMTSTGAGFSIESLPLAPDAIILSRDSTQATVPGGSLFFPNGAKIEERFYDTSKRFLAGMSRLSKWIVSTATAITNLVTSGLSLARSTRLTKEKSTTKTSKSLNFKPTSSTLSSVYDLANAGPRRRFVIKSDSGHLLVHNCELGLGYGGWVGALYAFGYEGTEAEARNVVVPWRDASPMIVEMWGGQSRGKPWAVERREFFGLEGCAVQAVLNPGQRFTYRSISYEVLGKVLYAVLPSGRRLAYQKPQLTLGSKKEGWEPVYSLTYMTWNTNAKMGPQGWVRMETYGGRLFENVVQAVARDIMACAVVKLEKAGWPIVLRVHDELAAEILAPPPADEWAYIATFEKVMADLPEWAEGWPIRAAGGWLEFRYHKD